jgi:DNA-binding transcriptional ArsR family regulator
MIIIQNQRLKSQIMSALSDSSMQKILRSTSFSDMSANDIIRAQGLPHSSTYRKINELIKCGLLVLYRLEIAGGKKIAYYKSTFHSIKVSYEGIADTKIEAEPNQDALERISSRFYDL